jgi:sporulation protein YlmC with PRC-barrel domain
MPASDRTVRAHTLIGSTVHDRSGKHLGRIVDLVLDDTDDQTPARVAHVMVTDRRWTRLLGYESPDEKGPWVLRALAHRIIRRHVRTLRWNDVVLDRDARR